MLAQNVRHFAMAHSHGVGIICSQPVIPHEEESAVDLIDVFTRTIPGKCLKDLHA